MHVGYCLSCYGDSSYVFSVPLSASRDEVRALLNRQQVINADPLTEAEVKALRAFVIGEVEIGWDDSLQFYLEGHNLPDDDSDWI